MSCSAHTIAWHPRRFALCLCGCVCTQGNVAYRVDKVLLPANVEATREAQGEQITQTAGSPEYVGACKVDAVHMSVHSPLVDGTLSKILICLCLVLPLSLAGRHAPYLAHNSKYVAGLVVIRPARVLATGCQCHAPQYSTPLPHCMLYALLLYCRCRQYRLPSVAA